MSKPSKEFETRMQALTAEQLDAKVKDQRQDLARLNAEHDYAARLLRDKRNAALRRK